MKLILGIFILINSIYIYARPYKRGVFKYPYGRIESMNNSIVRSNLDIQKSQDFLREIKFHILNGQLDQAKILLKEATITSNFTKAIQYRYLATIYFIEGNYRETLNILNQIEMSEFTTQAKVCFMKVISYLILEDEKNIKKSWRTCKDASIGYSPSNLAWMNVLVNMKITKDENYVENIFKEINIENIAKEDITTILKLSLYLSQQKELIPRFQFLGKEVLEDTIKRELIGFNYYRDNDLVRSFKLLSTISTANAEVFKGNILLARKKFELAYAQFKLALNTKTNSKNAIDRLLPLAWKLEKWDEGINFLQKTEFHKSKRVEAYTLMAAFLTMANKHNATKIYLNKIASINNKSAPLEIAQIRVFNSLIQKDEDNIIKYANQSCNAKDGINCWLLIAMNSWESLITEIDSKKKIHTGLKGLSKELANKKYDNPIQEEVLVEQRYIKELDNNLIQIVK